MVTKGRTKKGKKSKRTRFSYQSNDTEVTRRAAQGGGDFDSLFIGAVKLFKAADGKNKIRIMPRTWSDDAGPRHWSFTAHVHYQVGSDNAQYLCLQKMQSKPCPICEERAELAAEGDDEAAKKLRPSLTKLVWIIDRAHPEEGPKIWKMPAVKVHNSICDLSDDKDTGEVLTIDHPEEGYDVTFRKKGEKDRTDYSSVAIARSDSLLSDSDQEFDDWLDMIQENSIPAILNFFDYNYIKGVFGGSAGSRDVELDEDEDDEDETPPPRSSRRSRRAPVEEEDEDDEDEEEEEETPPPRSRRRRRPPVEEEDDDDDEDDEDEEEEETHSKLPRSRRRRAPVEDDEDDMDELDDPDSVEDDEDEEPAPKSRRKRRDLRSDISSGLKRRGKKK